MTNILINKANDNYINQQNDKKINNPYINIY